MTERLRKSIPRHIARSAGRIGKAVLAGILAAAVSLTAPLFLRVNAATVTEESIKEKESQISDAKEERDEISSNISDLKALKADLESSRTDLKNYITTLDGQVADIQSKIDELAAKISTKEEEITKTIAELDEAEKTQQAQYEAMKARIRFIYEKGDAYYLEMLLNASSFSDMMTKQTYIAELSEYDHRKLEEYKQQTEYVKVTKQALQEEQATLEEAKKAQEEEQANVQALIADKNNQVAVLTGQISDKESAIAATELDLSAADAEITELERQVAADKAALAAANQVHYNGGMFTWPAPSYTYISSDYGYRESPGGIGSTNHKGVDMAAPYGSPILAAYTGVVAAAGYSPSMGNYVMIDHGDGLYTIYMHASSLLVSRGDSVSAGQQIANVGSTGNSTGPHLHFGVRLNGQYVNPWNYLGH